ncbi:MAG: nitroreductase family protein [Nanoarchaeota archaeon]
MEFDSVIKKRKSVRGFTKKKTSWKDVLEAIDATSNGPFAGNQNNLKFLIVENKEIIKEIAGFCEQLWINESSILVLVLSDDTHLENIYGERGRVYSRQQAGAAIVTLLFKLVDLGLSACWVGAYSDEIVKEKLKIPQHIQIEAIIPVGHENNSVQKRDRIKRSLESSLYWEEWNKTRRPTLFEEGKEDYNPPS